MYVLWSTVAGGWFTKSSTYSTELSEAQQYARVEAMALAKRHIFSGTHAFGLIPVLIFDLDELAA